MSKPKSFPVVEVPSPVNNVSFKISRPILNSNQENDFKKIMKCEIPNNLTQIQTFMSVLELFRSPKREKQIYKKYYEILKKLLDIYIVHSKTFKTKKDAFRIHFYKKVLDYNKRKLSKSKTTMKDKMSKHKQSKHKQSKHKRIKFRLSSKVKQKGGHLTRMYKGWMNMDPYDTSYGSERMDCAVCGYTLLGIVSDNYIAQRAHDDHGVYPGSTVSFLDRLFGQSHQLLRIYTRNWLINEDYEENISQELNQIFERGVGTIITVSNLKSGGGHIFNLIRTENGNYIFYDLQQKYNRNNISEPPEHYIKWVLDGRSLHNTFIHAMIMLGACFSSISVYYQTDTNPNAERVLNNEATARYFEQLQRDPPMLAKRPLNTDLQPFYAYLNMLYSLETTIEHEYNTEQKVVEFDCYEIYDEEIDRGNYSETHISHCMDDYDSMFNADFLVILQNFFEKTKQLGALNRGYYNSLDVNGLEEMITNYSYQISTMIYLKWYLSTILPEYAVQPEWHEYGNWDNWNENWNWDENQNWNGNQNWSEGVNPRFVGLFICMTGVDQSIYLLTNHCSYLKQQLNRLTGINKINIYSTKGQRRGRGRGAQGPGAAWAPAPKTKTKSRRKRKGGTSAYENVNQSDENDYMQEYHKIEVASRRSFFDNHFPEMEPEIFNNVPISLIHMCIPDYLQYMNYNPFIVEKLKAQKLEWIIPIIEQYLKDNYYFGELAYRLIKLKLSKDIIEQYEDLEEDWDGTVPPEKYEDWRSIEGRPWYADYLENRYVPEEEYEQSVLGDDYAHVGTIHPEFVEILDERLKKLGLREHQISADGYIIYPNTDEVKQAYELIQLEIKDIYTDFSKGISESRSPTMNVNMNMSAANSRHMNARPRISQRKTNSKRGDKLKNTKKRIGKMHESSRTSASVTNSQTAFGTGAEKMFGTPLPPQEYSQFPKPSLFVQSPFAPKSNSL
jgi:hypothetical protein